MRLFALSLLSLAALTSSTGAPASQKPCRDASGKIISCPKATVKEVPPRHKDEKGRFAGTKAPANPADHR